MIIRIMSEGQYRVPESLWVPESLCDELNIIDNRIVGLVEEAKAVFKDSGILEG